MSTTLLRIVRAVLLEDTAPQQVGMRVYTDPDHTGNRDDSSFEDDEDDAEGVRGVDDDTPLASAEDEDEWRKRIIDFAMRYKNVPYAWSGQTPQGFDCSGFAWYVLKNSGLMPSLERTASGQQMELGQPIRRGQLKMGDLVGFKNSSGSPSHIGFYLRDNMYLSALGGNQETTLANPRIFKDGSRARVMEYDFTRDDRTQYYASISGLIAKRLKEDEKDKGLVASAEKDKQKKDNDKKTG